MGTVGYTVLDGEILSENRDGVKHDYVPDPLGSTVALLDNTQTQTDTYSFWPYGETRTSTGTTPTPFNFLGTLGYYADTAGISLKKYVRARYYDTFRSRWLTEDPIEFRGSDYNLYRYVKNNPTSYTDPSGKGIGDDTVCYSTWINCRIKTWLAVASCSAGCMTPWFISTAFCLAACSPFVAFPPAFGLCFVLCDAFFTILMLRCLSGCFAQFNAQKAACDSAFNVCMLKAQSD